MNIVILVVGTRGDIEPFIALGKELKKDGHRVRIGTHQAFEQLIEMHNIEFYDISGDPTELMKYMTENPGLIPKTNSVLQGDVKVKRKIIRKYIDGCWDACIMPDPKTEKEFLADAIISNPVTFAHIHCAEALRIPVQIFFTMPWTKTKKFPHPLAIKAFGSDKATVRNELLYRAVETLMWTGVADILNKFRVEKLGLKAIPNESFLGPSLLRFLKIPHTYLYSESLLPKPGDWPDHVDVTGFVFSANDGTNFEPPADLLSFLNKKGASKPIYIGFGSIVIRNKETLLKEIIEGISRIKGLRAVISRGWGGFSAPSDSENLHFIDDCPHTWLFPKVSAVVCHGGAGTTAQALRCGKPCMVIPFFGDQPFWGQTVTKTGAGCMIFNRKVTADRFEQSVRFLLKPETSRASGKIAAMMKNENGLQNAVKSFYSHLPIKDIQCDLNPNGEKAIFYFSRHNLKLSISSSIKLFRQQTLTKVDFENLQFWRPKCYRVPAFCEPEHLVAGLTRGFYGSAVRLVEGAIDFFTKPVMGALEDHPHVFVGFPLGVIKGTSSLCYKTTDSVAILISSVGAGAWNSSLGYDEMQEFSAASIRSGFKNGAKFFVFGLFQGPMDFFVKPVEGGRKSGLKGFIRGSGSGSISLLTKPIGGILQGVSLPYFGVRNHVQNRLKKKLVLSTPRHSVS